MNTTMQVKLAERIKGDPFLFRYIQGRNINYPVHGHDCCELVLVLHGTATHVTDVGTFPLSAGDVFVMTPPHEHGYLNGDKFYMANLQYPASFLQPLVDDLQRLPGYHLLFEAGPAVRRGKSLRAPGHLAAHDLALCTELCTRIQKENEERLPGFQAATRALFYELVNMLCRACTRVRSGDESLAARMAHVLAFIREHYHEKIILAQLIETAHSTKTRFIGEFQQVTGYTPIDFVIRLRVLKAAQLLQADPARSITDVAYQVGMDDSAYFSRQFKRMMGLTARAYRARQTKAKP